MNCPIPPADRMLSFLACSEAFEFGYLGIGLSWFRLYTIENADKLKKIDLNASLRGDPELQPQS